MVTVRLFNPETGLGDHIKYPLSLSGHPDLPITHEQLTNLTGMSVSGSSRRDANHRKFLVATLRVVPSGGLRCPQVCRSPRGASGSANTSALSCKVLMLFSFLLKVSLLFPSF